MKIKKGPIIAVAAILGIVLVIAGIRYYQKNASRTVLAKRIVELSPGGAPPETIEGLKAAIAAYEEQIEGHVQDAAQTGVYWKILATRLQDRGLHNEALEALERTIYYYPEDPSPHYLTGLSAAIVAKSTHNFAGARENTARERYYALAEAAYLRAIELDSRYVRPLYGLGVLYVFELNRPADAIPYLTKHMELRASDVDAMFVLARAYYMIEEYEPALDLYDRIIATTRDASKKAEAELNKQTVLDMLYG